jgi:hypothetical protein
MLSTNEKNIHYRYSAFRVLKDISEKGNSQVILTCMKIIKHKKSKPFDIEHASNVLIEIGDQGNIQLISTLLGIIRHVKDYEDPLIVICSLKILNSVCVNGDFRLLHSMFQLIKSTSCSQEIRDEASQILGNHSKNIKKGARDGIISSLLEILKKDNWCIRESILKILLLRYNNEKKEAIEFLIRYLIEYPKSIDEISTILLSLKIFIKEETTIEECNHILLQLFTDEDVPNFETLFSQCHSKEKILRDISLYLLYNFVDSKLDLAVINTGKLFRIQLLVLQSCLDDLMYNRKIQTFTLKIIQKCLISSEWNEKFVESSFLKLFSNYSKLTIDATIKYFQFLCFISFKVPPHLKQAILKDNLFIVKFSCANSFEIRESFSTIFKHYNTEKDFFIKSLMKIFNDSSYHQNDQDKRESIFKSLNNSIGVSILQIKEQEILEILIKNYLKFIQDSNFTISTKASEILLDLLNQYQKTEIKPNPNKPKSNSPKNETGDDFIQDVICSLIEMMNFKIFHVRKSSVHSCKSLLKYEMTKQTSSIMDSLFTLLSDPSEEVSNEALKILESELGYGNDKIMIHLVDNVKRNFSSIIRHIREKRKSQTFFLSREFFKKLVKTKTIETEFIFLELSK